MAPLVGLAVSMASKYLPELIGSALDSKKAENVAKIVTDAAVAYTGGKPAHEALKAVENDKEFFMAQKKDILSVIELEVRDIQHARENQCEDEVTKYLSFIVMCVNPLLIAGCVWALISVAESDMDVGLITTISAVLGGAINNFFQERQQVMNFRFGSSLGSKLKNLIKK